MPPRSPLRRAERGGSGPTPRLLAALVLAASWRSVGATRRLGLGGGARLDVVAGGAPPRRRALVRRALSSLLLAPAAAKSQETELMSMAWDEEPQVIMEVADLNRDGRVSLREYKVVARETLDHMGVMDPKKRKETLDFFKRLHAFGDVNGDGHLQIEELDFIEQLARTYVWDIEVTEDGVMGDLPPDPEVVTEDASHIVAFLDIDGDRRLSRSEFMKGLGDVVATWHTGGGISDPEVAQWAGKTFKRADIDCDGYLGFKEALFAQMAIESAWEDGLFADRAWAAWVLETLDKDADETIDRWEVSDEAAPELVGADVGVEDVLPFIRSKFDEVDADGDGRLDRAEVRLLGAALLEAAAA